MQEVILLEKAEFYELISKIEMLSKRVEELGELLDEEVTSKEASKITGVSVKTLEIERNRPGTLIIYSKIGRSVRYSRASLMAYKKSKRMRKPRR
ncbi:helix-turn-helix domain-containing protein [Pontibacter sp. SGAir0037]|uniref:helix-turn-helix domain-containing protein n=1 Tax=Pontibacter sp. SGAir0037 TaxID=2571030 RepID=UPI0010CCCD48|nr:helix-turn-helix domain-containing protein [Pontibacter sp. SGAir0037]QCR23771.1 hypothetical protein C1N53_16395 [Pontibacter sp. SGAir0037]